MNHYCIRKIQTGNPVSTSVAFGWRRVEESISGPVVLPDTIVMGRDRSTARPAVTPYHQIGLIR